MRTGKNSLPEFSFLLVLFLTLLFLHCKNTSTAPEVEVPEPEPTSITVKSNPSSGGTNTNFTIVISINNSDMEVKVFGLEMTFDADTFQFRRIEMGGLTESWEAVDANEISNGTLRVGGYAGSGNPITQGNTGNIAGVKFKVIGSSFSDGQQSQICIQNYTDDISSMTPEPSCINFTLQQ
jgi:hypothetical protein